MRNLLTFLAVALVALLTAALIAPVFVDWNGQRDRLSAALGQRLGASVAIEGPIEARLLPTPYLTMGDVRIGKPGDALDLTARSMRFEMGLAGLFGGQLRFTEVHFQDPVAILTLPEGGALTPGVKSGAPLIGFMDRISLERFRVDGGQLTLRRGAEVFTLSGVAFDVAARSLKGPFRGGGDVAGPGGRKIAFQLVAGELAEAALPLKLELDAGAGIRANFDGRLRLPVAGRASPEFDGAANFVGMLNSADTPLPWRVSGSLRATPHEATLDSLAASVGPETRALDATGRLTATLGAGAPQIEASLSAKQLNIDALLRREGEASAPPERLFRVLTGLADSFGARPSAMGVTVALSAPTAYLGAQTIDNIDLAAGWNADRGFAIDGGATLPGRSHVHLTGGVEFGAAAAFRGHWESESEDAVGLATWATQGQEESAGRFTSIAEAFAGGPISVKADVEASNAGFSARNLELALGRSKFSGAVTMLRPAPAQGGRLYVNLHTNLLDIDSAPNLLASGDWLGDLDLVLALDADKLHIAQVGLAAVESGSLALEASKSGDRLSLDKLSVSDLGGASVTAAGEATADSQSLRINLNAGHLKSFAELVARVAPGRYSRLFLERAEALSPAKAVLSARREGAALDADFPLDFLTVEGEAAQNRFSLKVGAAPAPIDAVQADLSLDAPDGSALLRALGMKAAVVASGRAKLTASATGKWGPGFDSSGSLAFAGADLAWRGRLTPNANEGEPFAYGSATLKSDNFFAPLAALGVSPPSTGVTAPADLAADFVWRPEAASAPRIVGALAGAKVNGKLSWRAPAPPTLAVDPTVALATAATGETEPVAPITGELSFDRGSAAALLGLALGAQQAPSPGAVWSDTRFAAPWLRPPATDVQLHFGAFDLWDGQQARGVSARLRMDPSKFELQDVSMQGIGGHVEGRIALRREGEVAALSGHLAFDDLAIDKPALKGHIAAAFDLAGTGRSPLSLVSSLVADGKARLSGVTAPKLDPAALGRVVARAQALDGAPDESNVEHWLAGEFDKQALALPDGETPSSIGAGVLHAGPLDIAEPGGRTTISSDFDLRSLDFAMRAQFVEANGGKFWTGSPPSTVVTVQNGFATPTRKIEATLLTAGLATQALAREVDRVANLEADLRERAYFNRRLRAERFLREREAEIAAYNEEQSRLNVEAQRRGVEEARLGAYEARVKAEDDAARAAEKRAEEEQERARAANAPGAPADAPAPQAGTAPETQPAVKANAPDPAVNGIY